MRARPKVVTVASAVMAIGILAACSDAPTAAPARAFVPKANLAVGDVTNSTPVVGVLKICKAGNTGGTFVITDVGDGIGGTGTPKSLLSPLSVTNGQCRIAAENLGNSTANQGDFYSVVENAPAVPGTTQQLTSCVGLEGAIACNNNYFVNNVHGVVLTFTNTLPPPPPPAVCDFSTFGGFVLAPNNISYGGNAGRVEDGFAYGSLNFENHTTGDHIHVWNVTVYEHPASGPLSGFADSRLASGTGTINGAGSYPVEFRFLDAGEPGVDDRVYLKVNGVVLIPEQVVQGGNIQLHKNCKKAPTDEKH